jgi:hypothetical protein
MKTQTIERLAYGMATFEGPTLALKNVNAIAHYTDWIISHVHIGALGWNGFLTFGILYWLIPRLYKTTLYSRKLANLHFWLGTLGIAVASMFLLPWVRFDYDLQRSRTTTCPLRPRSGNQPRPRLQPHPGDCGKLSNGPHPDTHVVFGARGPYSDPVQRRGSRPL